MFKVLNLQHFLKLFSDVTEFFQSLLLFKMIETGLAEKGDVFEWLYRKSSLKILGKL